MHDLGNSTHAFLHKFIARNPYKKNEELMKVFYDYRYASQALNSLNKDLLRLELELATSTSATDRLIRQKEIENLKSFISKSNLSNIITKKRNQIIECNLKLVLSVANRYANLGLTVDDCFQAGIIGFIHGINKYDPEMGTKLTSYCTWWIRQRITREISNTGRIIRIPVPVSTDITKLLGYFRKSKGSINSKEDLYLAAESLGFTMNRALELRRLIRNFYPLNQIIIKTNGSSEGESEDFEDTFMVLSNTEHIKDSSDDYSGNMDIAIDIAYFMNPLDSIISESDPITKYILCKKFGLNIWDSEFYTKIDADIYKLIETSSLEKIPLVHSRRVIQYFASRALFDLIDDPNKPAV